MLLLLLLFFFYKVADFLRLNIQSVGLIISKKKLFVIG